MIYLLTVKEILILSNNIYLFTKSIIIRGNYILTRNYIHLKEPYQFVHSNQLWFVQGNISSFNETYSFSTVSCYRCHTNVKIAVTAVSAATADTALSVVTAVTSVSVAIAVTLK